MGTSRLWPKGAFPHRARLAKLSVQMCCDSSSECCSEPTDVASVDHSSAVSRAACSFRRGHGATVARRTLSQKVGSSSFFALRRSIDLDHARQPRIYFSPLRSSLVKGIGPRMAVCRRRKLPRPCVAAPPIHNRKPSQPISTSED